MAGENHEFRISGNGVDKEPINVFTMDSQTGEVFVHRSVDREQYENTFHVSNRGIAPVSPTFLTVGEEI